MSESAKKAKFKADGTVSSCIKLKKPIPPNKCEECSRHSDISCKDLEKRKHGKP
jgi:hypothetical protein